MKIFLQTNEAIYYQNFSSETPSHHITISSKKSLKLFCNVLQGQSFKWNFFEWDRTITSSNSISYWHQNIIKSYLKIFRNSHTRIVTNLSVEWVMQMNEIIKSSDYLHTTTLCRRATADIMSLKLVFFSYTYQLRIGKKSILNL